MGAKKIKRRRFVPDIARVNRLLHTVAANDISIHVPPGAAPIPIWEFTRPLPGPSDVDAPIPAIRPELVDPVIIVTDPYVVRDFENTGVPMARMLDLDEEKMILWLIDKSRDIDARKIDAEFAIDMGADIRDRTIGTTLASLVKHGRARVVATHDDGKVIVQMIFTPEDYESAETNHWVQYWRDRKRQ